MSLTCIAVQKPVRQRRGYLEPSGSVKKNSCQASSTNSHPQGRIHQIEYAMEAVKQVTTTLPRALFIAPIFTRRTYALMHKGSATIGLKSKTHVVLVALKRSTSELSSYQKKIYPIDDHIAVSIAGLTSDGRLLR